VLVVGAGQAGLATGYWLRRLAPDLEVALVDAAEALGDTWRQRWDSLRLFTPRTFSALPGLKFPTGSSVYPDRLEMADYLETYAVRFDLPVHTGARVQGVTPGFTVATSAGPVTARHVVLASGPFHHPLVPTAADDLDPSIPQLHSYDYRGPADIPTEEVVVVGGGNSAAQIALELSRSHRVTLVAPREPWFVPARVLGLSSYHWMSWLGILDADVEGRVVRYVRRRGDAIFGRELRDQLRRGQVAMRTSRVVGAAGRSLTLADGSTVPTTAVVWCTGFHTDFDWLRVPGAVDAAGNPVHDRGTSPIPGLHWMGLPWQETLSSSIIYGTGPDARRCAERISAKL
jgi:putative flavoprotein involved in K+ transport